ncbi:hypothetical protein KY345_04225 [Candidatus Woesearchaeota archaeon]|nr:hypothetical protein [Candidatus Woesearchaeota archaeon]
MEIKKEKSKLKAAEFEMKIFSENNLIDLRNLDTNVIINQLEANIEGRKNPIEKRIKKKFEEMR